MRLIGTLADERKALIFSFFLNQKGIPHQIEISTNTDWGSADYGSSKCAIWIQEEDQVPEAMKWYQFFLENPNDPIFQHIKNERPFLSPLESLSSTSAPPPPPNQNIEDAKLSESPLRDRQPMGPITRFLLWGCCLLFFIGQLTTAVTNVSPGLSGLLIFTSPVAKVVLYDYPRTYELIDRFIKLYGLEGLQDTSNLPPEAHSLIDRINQTPYWQGLYAIIQKQGFVKTLTQWPFDDVPMFEKIRQGQVWRLFSPAIFHADLFHLFFNMLWLVVLGKQIEQRLGSFRYILFILFIGIISNTAQYLMSGPNFVGFSGVLTGMLTFIWARQRYAPWEGYRLDAATIVFMLIFILSMAAIQFFSFFLETSLDITISPGIANVAHLMGALLGFILGRLNFFSWRHSA